MKFEPLTTEEYNEILDEQGGGCAICDAKPKLRKDGVTPKRLHTDHDHRSGLIRGLLCYRCNRALPNYVTARWLRRALVYIERTTLLTPEVRR